MLLVRPLTLGTMKVEKLKNGKFAVTNNEKPPHRIIIYCRALQHAESLLYKMQQASAGELIEF